MTLAQSLAIAIFLIMFITIIVGRGHRYVPALIGAALTIVVVFFIVERSLGMAYDVLNLGALARFRFWIPGHEPLESHGVNWQTLTFILGMMILVEGLGETGFFRWLCLHGARIARYRPVGIMVLFMLLSGFLSMFIGSITVMLFLARATIELARLLKFDPVPVIIGEILASNIGGASTMSGDPPNIIIGTALGYTFSDFVVNTGLIAWAGMIVTLLFFYFSFRKTLAPPSTNAVAEASPQRYPEPREAILNPLLFRRDVVIFFLVVALIVTHAQSGLSLGLVGVIAGLITLVAAGRKAGHILARIDWRTLLFFLGLFISVGGLEETGVLQALAERIGDISGDSLLLAITLILWLSFLISAIVDNIPFAATMVPVIAGLSETSGFSLRMLSWTLALGSNLGGNATPIGASANVVGTAIAHQEGYPISWGRYCKQAFIPILAVVTLSWLLLLVRYI